MDPPVVDALLDVFGPFLFPALLFAAGVVGYGVLLLVNRLRSSEGTDEWSTETPIVSDDATDPDGHEG